MSRYRGNADKCGTVLGKWHQMKKELWLQHTSEACEQLPANLQAMEQSTCSVPF